MSVSVSTIGLNDVNVLDPRQHVRVDLIREKFILVFTHADTLFMSSHLFSIINFANRE